MSRIELAWPGRTAGILPLFERPEAPRRFPGIATLLRKLDREGLLLAVVSSRRLAALHRGLDATGLRSHFPVVIGLEDVTTPKPSPEGLLLALERLGAPPAQAVFVGDSDLDGDGAVAAVVEEAPPAVKEVPKPKAAAKTKAKAKAKAKGKK